MKTKILIVALLLIAGVPAVNAQKIILHMAGNQKAEYSASQLDSITFTEIDLPDVDPLTDPSVTGYAIDITNKSATLVGYATSVRDNLANDLRVGFIYCLEGTPSKNNGTQVDISPNNVAEDGSYTATIGNLLSNATYYFRSFVYQSGLWFYGKVKSFVTGGIDINFTTGEATNITCFSAKVSGSIDVQSSYSTLEYGICYGTDIEPTTNDKTLIASSECPDSYTIQLRQLMGGTIYYYRPYAIVDSQTYYGTVRTFHTLEDNVVETGNIDKTTLTVTSHLTIGGGAYSSLVLGVCYGNTEQPTILDKAVTSDEVDEDNNYTVTLVSPGYGTIYYRAYILIDDIPHYGAVKSFVSTSEQIDPGPGGLTAIDFGINAKPRTRATHEESAALLGGKFLLYGTKTKDAVESPVFDNYWVEYSANTAGNTISNSGDWEYVGKQSKKGAVQAVKYWDYSAERFDFVAAAGLAANELILGTTGGLRVNVPDAEAMTSIYIANRITATPTAQAPTATTPTTVAYKNTVQFQFRRMGAQMRIGFYETVPGYAIKDLVFYFIGAPSGSKEVGVGAAFPTSGKYTVSYDDTTNVAVVTFAGSGNQMAFSNTFGKLEYVPAFTQEGVAGKPYLNTNGKASATAVNAFLGTSSTQATYGKGTFTIDGVAGVPSVYKPILPNEDNSLKMQIRVDYTLIALDGSGDSIHVRDAYVSVPASFLKWKPNYSYTYLFKISDNSNGYIGEGGGGTITTGPGRDPDPNNGGGDNDPVTDPVTGKVIPPYIPDPSYPEIPDPDNPDIMIPNPLAPLIPNPDYPVGPEGDQHDPSNPVPVPSIPDPNNPGGTIPDPTNPARLFPITFDAVVIETEEGGQTVITSP